MPRRWFKSSALAASLLALASCAGPTDKLTLTPVSYGDLEGWTLDDHRDAFAAFDKSCEKILKRDPGTRSGSGMLAAPASVWQEPCNAASNIDPQNPDAVRNYFEANFSPYRAGNNGKEEGLFTGYYEPELTGSLTKSAKYNIPVYRLPPDVEKDQPYLTRAEIEAGKLAGKKLELAWTDDRVGLFFLQIQGSGHIKLEDGRLMRIGYAGKNNQRYVSLGKIMGDRGLISKDEVNFFTIRQWLRDNPAQAKKLMQENPSYVFFRPLQEDGSVGGSGAVLTPWRSMAVDTRFVPYPTPLFLQTTLPETSNSALQPFNRLLIAQDTGGAIKGPVRGDVFFGPGLDAEQFAGMMKQRGRYALLLPRGLAKQVD